MAEYNEGEKAGIPGIVSNLPIRYDTILNTVDDASNVTSLQIFIEHHHHYAVGSTLKQG